MQCPIHCTEIGVVFCPCDEDFLTSRAQLEVNYWRWRAESSEFARVHIPLEWRFLAEAECP